VQLVLFLRLRLEGEERMTNQMKAAVVAAVLSVLLAASGWLQLQGYM